IAKAMKRFGKIQMGIAAALVIAIAAGLAVYINLPSKDEIAALRQALAARAQEDFPSTDALRAAAFAVIRRDATGAERLLGTAWPFKPGVLITNAHVAKVV